MYYILISAGTFLFVDGTPCVLGLQTGLAAVEILLAAFYVLNRHYPVECGATLEFAQR